MTLSSRTLTTAADLRPRVEAGDMTITSQEIFEAVAVHLFTQGVQSIAVFDGNDDDEKHEGCAYRAPNGASCAVGALIPDALYDKEFENKNIHAVCKDNRSLACLYQHSELLGALQSVHDSDEPWQSSNHMREALRAVITHSWLNPKPDGSFLNDLAFGPRAGWAA